MAIPALAKELIVAGAKALIDEIAKRFRRKPRDGWVDVKVSDPPAPLSYKDVAHQQAQIASATEPHDPALCPRCQAGVCSGRGRLPVDRNATTARPPKRAKPGTLPSK